MKLTTGPYIEGPCAPRLLACTRAWDFILAGLFCQKKKRLSFEKALSAMAVNLQSTFFLDSKLAGERPSGAFGGKKQWFQIPYEMSCHLTSHPDPETPRHQEPEGLDIFQD